MHITSQNLIELFISGETNAITGNRNNPGNLSIRNNQIFHYETPILERNEGKYIFNISRYSLQTNMVQKRIRETLDVNKMINVKGIPRGYKGSLKDFINKEN